MHRAKCVFLLSALLGCASNTAPHDFLMTPAEAREMAFGGWMELDLTSERVEGELLAVTADSVWVMTAQGGRAIATTAVRTGKLTGYKGQQGMISGYTALGVVSTLSNGVALILTAPLWIIVGTTAASNESRAPQRIRPDAGRTWPELALFARFPQGMPERWPDK